jgi:WD40 repeat protein
MENTPKIENLSIATNLNTVFDAFDFCPQNKLIAYASSNLVCILEQHHYHSQYPKVLLTLKGHKERVNAVRWLTESLLVSVSADKSFIVWGYDGKEFKQIQ